MCPAMIISSLYFSVLSLELDKEATRYHKYGYVVCRSSLRGYRARVRFDVRKAGSRAEACSSISASEAGS